MNNDKPKSSLRKQAEKLLKMTTSLSADEQALVSEQIKHLIQEIEAHAVKFETQDTELKETRNNLEISRQYYYDLFDAAPVGCFTLDDKGIVVEVNQTGQGMLGLPRNSIINSLFTRFVAEQDLQPFTLLLHRVRQGHQRERVKLTLKSQMSKDFAAQIDVAVVKHGSAQEEPLTHVIALDISEQRYLEQQRDMFFSIASHELRTPITNISLSLDLILKHEKHRLPDNIRENLEIAYRATLRLKHLIRDMLELRNASRADLRLDRLPVDLASLIRETISLNTPFAKRLDIVFRIQEPLPNVAVIGDEDRLVQVLNNLLTNAVKYSTAGGEVRIEVQSHDEQVRISVSDDGIGISDKLAERIFEPFTQAEPSIEDSRHRDSYGLGLSISRALVDKMGGSLGFTSNEGQGSTFFFELAKISAE